MKFTTKTEYGLVCLIYMAKNGKDNHWLPIKSIVEKEKFSPAYIEKILQKLKSANIVQSHQGKDGGYSLSRKASEISLREIIEALEGQTFDVYCEPDTRKDIICTHLSLCGIKHIWMKTKNLLDDYYSSVSLADLAQQDEVSERSVA